MNHIKEKLFGRKIVIVDLDGCVFDDSHRLHLADFENKKFDEYHSKLHLDQGLRLGATFLCSAIAKGYLPAFLTARPESVRLETDKKIKGILGKHGQYLLLMRKKLEEGIPAHILKSNMLNFLWNNGLSHNIIAAIDDDIETVNMYRENGINAYLVNAKQVIQASSREFSEIRSEGETKCFRDKIGEYDFVHNPDVCSGEQDELYDAFFSWFGPFKRTKGERVIRQWNPEIAKNNHSASDERKFPEPTFTPGESWDGREPPTFGNNLQEEYDKVMKAFSIATGTPLHMLQGHPKNGEGEGFEEFYEKLLYGRTKKEGEKVRILIRNPKEAKSADTILESAAETFREKQEFYRNNPDVHAKVMAALFPNGVTITTMEEQRMWQMFNLLVVKLTRFTNTGLKHQDSIRDLCVYAAMCETLVETHEGIGIERGGKNEA